MTRISFGIGGSIFGLMMFLIPGHVLIWVLAVPGVFFWWLACLVVGFLIEERLDE